MSLGILLTLPSYNPLNVSFFFFSKQKSLRPEVAHNVLIPAVLLWVMISWDLLTSDTFTH